MSVNVDHWRTSLNQTVHGPLKHHARPTGGLMDESKAFKATIRTKKPRKRATSLIGRKFDYASALKSVQKDGIQA